MEQRVVETRPIEQIVWREDLYPRFEPDPVVIQRYADSLEHLPPIEVNQRNELIDGYHRWTAHKTRQVADVPVVVTPTESDAHVLRLAIERNATHGLQLKPEEKKHLLGRLYTSGEMKDKDALSRLFAVGRSTVFDWLANYDKAERERQQRQVFALWLSCHTQDEIAEQTDLPQPTIHRWLEDLSKSPALDFWIKDDKKYTRSLDGSAEWSPPLYNIWSFAAKTNDVGHFGNSEQRIVDNLLYLYTEPLEVVLDPFAGGGSTIDVCKRRLRRYWVADRQPIEARRDVRQADIADGPPRLPWSEVALVYLDPPYWRQARNQYSEDAADLANMPLADFYAALTGYIRACAAKMRSGAHIACLIQPTQWLADDRKVVDHVVDLIAQVGNGRLESELRIICPYSTEQYNAQQVEWAKANRQVLVLSRELIVWKVR